MNQADSWQLFETVVVTFLVMLNLYTVGTEANFTEIKGCGKHTRCSTRSGKDESTLVCRCDEHCHLYGDCCLDIANKIDDHHRPQDIKGISRKYWKCISTYKKNNTDPKSNEPLRGIYAVARCPELSFVGSLCSRNLVEGQTYHYTLDLPVYSKTTGIIYANAFCAYCHGEFSNLQELNVQIRCNTNITVHQMLSEGVYIRGEREWKLRGNNCSLVAALEEGDVGSRECLVTQDTCALSHTNRTQAFRCSAYSNTVTATLSPAGADREYIVFKNPYCALCNGVSHRDLRCLRIESRQTQGSLSMIMNFNWDFAGCNFPQEVFDGVRGRCHAIGVGEQSCLSEPLDANATCNVGQSPLTMKVQGYLTVGCLVVSITCLLLHNVVFYSLPNLQNLPSRILKSLCWSLVIAQSLFLTGVTPVISVPIAACKAVAVTLHFFFLSAFFWMNVMSVDVWTTFSRLSLRGSTTHTLRNYSIYAWGGPFLISGVALVADLTDYVPEIVRPLFGGFPGVCWFANRIALGLFLYMPICLLLGVNMALFAITVCWLQRQKTHPDLVKQASGRKECKRLWLYAKLSTIMGLSWSFGMIASLLDRPDFWYPFILFNGLQGAFIFIMFDVKRSVLETLFRHYGFLSDKGAQKPSGGLTLRSSRSSASTSCPQTTSKI